MPHQIKSLYHKESFLAGKVTAFGYRYCDANWYLGYIQAVLKGLKGKVATYCHVYQAEPKEPTQFGYVSGFEDTKFAIFP